MTISRRSHPKSRSGCKTCKARKVKCDENKPACRNCIKHQVKCDFLADGNFSSSSATSSPAPSNGLGSTGLNMADLELLHNYTTLTYATLTEEPGMRDYYRVNLVQMGFRHEYIMRTLLSLSALHIAHHRRQSTDHYVSLGMAHHQAASRTVMNLMLNINAENAPMLFLFSNLTMFFALGAPRQESDFLLVGESGFPDWIQLLRGVHLFQPYLTEESKTGELGPILQDGGRRWLALMTAKLKDEHQPAKQHLGLLARSVRQAFSSPRCSSNHNGNSNSNNSNGGGSSSSTSSNDGVGDGLVETVEDRDRLLTTYLNAIEMLGRCFAIFYEPPPIWDHAVLSYGRFDPRLAFIWLFEMTDGLLPLLRIPTQEAAVLMAFFATLLNKAADQWWIKGWPEHIIARVYALLDEEHRLWISWPMQEMGWMPPL